VVAAGVTIYALWPKGGSDRVSAEPTKQSWEIPAVISLTIAALLVRLFDLTGHPYILNGSEASMGLDALSAGNGQILTPFGTGWLTNPTLPFFILSLPVKLFGPSAISIRLLSPLIGAATIPTLYFAGRRWLGGQVALMAAILLAGSHVHIHYSRLGLTNVWDPLLALLVFGLVYAAWQNGRRQSWLLAGLAVGLTPYLFTTAHLFPFMLPLIVLALLLRLPYPPGYVRNLLAAAILALVVALPQLLFYRANPELFMDRANTLGIFQSNWFVEESVRTGQNSAEVLITQLRQAFFAFQGGQDTSNAYNPGVSLLSFWPAIFFTFGLGLALWRLRQFRYQLLLIWLGVTIVTVGFLIQSPPSSHRLLIAIPAVYLIAALALGWLGQQLLTMARLNKRYFFPVLILLAVFMGISDLTFYFGEYQSQHRFGDRNTEIAYEVATYLNNLDGEWEAYFHAPPNMYAGFPTFPFLLEELGQGLSFTDITEGEQPQPPDGNTVYLFIPERAAEIPIVQSLYPNGRVLTFEGFHANPLFYAYEIQP
jgi:4-amino-4-deoxy-L-arabinose transferase-like glycosyltransferase